jgi:hypothetical protein
MVIRRRCTSLSCERSASSKASRSRERIAARERHGFRARIDGHHFVEPHFDAFIAAQNFADRLGNIGGRERRGCDLIEQRLKQMMVLPVDQGDGNVLGAQPARHLDTGKPRADDEDTPEAIRFHPAKSCKFWPKRKASLLRLARQNTDRIDQDEIVQRSGIGDDNPHVGSETKPRLSSGLVMAGIPYYVLHLTCRLRAGATNFAGGTGAGFWSRTR